MKYLLPFIFMYSSALGQQLPTGPLQFVRDTKTVNVKEDTITPSNSVALPVSVFGTVTVAGPLAVTQSGTWTTGRTWSLLDSTDSITSFLNDGTGNAITSTAGALDVNIASGSVSVTNPSVGIVGDPVPTSAGLMGAVDGLGDLRSLFVDPSGYLNVNVQTSALPTGAATEATLFNIDGKIVNADTDSVTIVSSVLPTGAATESTLASIDSKITAVDTGDVTVTSSVLPTGAATEATLSSVDGKIPSNLTVTATRLLVDGSGVTQPVSGTLAISNPGLTDAELRASPVDVVASSLPLPTGASTESTLSALEAKIPSGLTVTSTRLLTDGSGVTQPVSIAASVQTKDPINTGGSYFDASISAVDTITAPANAVEVIIQADDTNTENLRFKIGGTASTNSGIQLQPGRSETLKVGANISIIPEAGTQKYNVQFITQ